MKCVGLILALIIALLAPAFAAPTMILVDPNTANPASVTNGQLLMNAPSGIMTALNSNGLTTLVQCDQTARITAFTASAVLIAHVAGKTTYICTYNFGMGLLATTTSGLAWGTGTNCGSSTLAASPILSLGISVTGANLFTAIGMGIGAVDSSPVVGVSDYCIIVTASAVVNGTIRYAQF